MKLKKIKIKKKSQNSNGAPNVPRESSKMILGFIGVTALLFLVVCYIVFGIWIALPFTILYLLMMWLVGVIDKYPVGSKTRKRARNVFMLILLLGILTNSTAI